MAALETFLLKSRIECCGTCRHWTIKMRGEGKKRGPVKWCPVLGTELPGLTNCGCAAWVRERHETFALGLYAEIEKELNDAEG